MKPPSAIQLKAPPIVTSLLLLLLAGIFIDCVRMTNRSLAHFVDNYAFVPGQLAGRFQAEAVTIITSTFVHTSWIHVASNLICIGLLGAWLESELGHWQLGALFFGCGLAATLLQWLIEPFSPMPIAGASGAAAGLIGACFGRIRSQSHQINASANREESAFHHDFFSQKEQAVILVAALWFALQFFNSASPIGTIQIQSGATAFFAQVGGLVAGIWAVRLLSNSGA